MRKLAVTAFLLALVSIASAQDDYTKTIEKWRADHEADLRSEGNWLTVAGLSWLKEGKNTVGAGDTFDVALTDSFTGGKFGEIDFSKGVATLTVEPGVEASSNGQKVTTLVLDSDEKGKPTRVTVGTQTFYLIKRVDKYGIRLKDNNSKARREFKGEHWYKPHPRYKVTATYEQYPQPKDVLIPNVLGTSFKEKAPGLLRFKIAGKQYTLEPVIEDDHLFIIFKDLTSKTTTYGAGRFLYAAMPKNGKVELDFNKAENPPCAFTVFATCPLPPKQNRLNVSIPAGELRNH